PPSLLPLSFFSSMLLRPPCSTLFPYTTLFRSFAAGRARISFNLQKATVKQENVSTLWGAKTLVAFGLRYVEANSNFDMARYGRAWIEYNPRYIEPRGLFQQFPSNHQIGMSRSVGMLGHDSARFGSRIIPENQTL